MKQLLIIFFVGLSSQVYSQKVNHNFTLNSSANADAKNFQTWEKFLSFIDTFALKDTVTLDVLTDFNLNAQIRFQNIIKLKDTARLIIHGHGHTITGDFGESIILINNSSYIEFDSLWIVNRSKLPTCVGIRIQNNSNFNRISHCKLELSSSKSKYNGYSYIAFSDRDSGKTSSILNPGSFNIIEFNQMYTDSTNGYGPLYGIVFLGQFQSSNIPPTNNTFNNNSIINVCHSGIKNWFSNGDQISANSIKRNRFENDTVYKKFIGIDINYSFSTIRSFLLESNDIYETNTQQSIVNTSSNDRIGIQITSMFSNSKFPCVIKSNLIHGFSTYGSFTGVFFSGNWVKLNNNKIYNIWQPCKAENVVNFTGIYTSITQGELLIDSNSIYDCNGATYWRGIMIDKCDLKHSKIIRYNSIKNNKHIYGSFSGIHCVNLAGSDKLRPITIKDNSIIDNQSYNDILIGIGGYFEGNYHIEHNSVESNTSNFNVYGLFFRFSNSAKIIRNIIFNNSADSAKMASVYPIFHREAINSYIASNLIYDNTSNNTIYGIYLTSDAGKETVFKVIQNTIQINLRGTKNLSRVAQLLNIELNTASFELIGNLIDAELTYKATEYLQVPSYSIVKSNSYSHRYSDHSAQWYLTGKLYSEFDFASNYRNGNKYSSIGLFFNSDFASPWFYNQDNIETDTSNLYDINGAKRNQFFSDRGAVEYFGKVSLSQLNALSESNLYPNPTSSDFITLVNASQNTSFEIFDIDGRIVQRGVLDFGSNIIDISNLRFGVYFIRLNNEMNCLKLIVNK